jgi:hypothetical protein
VLSRPAPGRHNPPVQRSARLARAAGMGAASPLAAGP